MDQKSTDCALGIGDPSDAAADGAQILNADKQSNSRKPLLAYWVGGISAILLLISLSYYLRSIEGSPSDSDLKIKAVARYSDGTPESFLRLTGSKGIDIGYGAYLDDLSKLRSSGHIFGIAGGVLLFLSYFMFHAWKISDSATGPKAGKFASAEKLSELQFLLDQNLISKEEYEKRREKVITSI